MTKSKLIIFAENYVDGDIVLSRLRSNGKSFISIVDLMNTPSKRKSYPSIFCMVQLIDSKKPDDFLAEYFISYTYIEEYSAYVIHRLSHHNVCKLRQSHIDYITRRLHINLMDMGESDFNSVKRVRPTCFELIVTKKEQRLLNLI